MKRIFLGLLLGIFSCGLSFGQTAGSMKLLQYSLNDQITSDGLKIGNDFFFAISSVDTSYMPQPTQRACYIVKVDSSFSPVKTIKITPDSIRFCYLDCLFEITDPVTLEKTAGFIGIGAHIDTVTQDSFSFLFVGYVSKDLSTVKFYNDFFQVPPQVSPFSTVVFPFYRYRTSSVYVPNDTTFLVLTRDYLLRFVYDSQGFYLADSISKTTGREFFSLLNAPLLVTELQSSGALYTYPLLWQTGLSNPPYKITHINLPGSYPDFSFDGSLGGQSYQDTLFAFGFIRGNSFYQYLYKMLYNTQQGLVVIDSFLLEQNMWTYSRGVDSWHHTSLIYPYMFIALTTSPLNNHFPTLWDFEWMHYSFDSTNHITLYRTNVALKSKQRIDIGGDAFYETRGLIGVSDSVCIVYGWRFPLGDTIRYDGDAFIWKISWNSGIVTSVLGKAPEYVFKIFPNPASERLQVQGKTKHATTLLLRSTDGKELLRKEFSAETTLRELDVSNLPKGVYVLEILTETGRIFSEKVVLE